VPVEESLLTLAPVAPLLALAARARVLRIVEQLRRRGEPR
jgi:hypothetical protein